MVEQIPWYSIRAVRDARNDDQTYEWTFRKAATIMMLCTVSEQLMLKVNELTNEVNELKKEIAKMQK